MVELACAPRDQVNTGAEDRLLATTELVICVLVLGGQRRQRAGQHRPHGLRGDVRGHSVGVVAHVGPDRGIRCLRTSSRRC